MKLTFLIFLAVLSVVVIIECKPLSDDGEKAPCVDCEQKHLRQKRFFPWLFFPPPPPPFFLPPPPPPPFFLPPPPPPPFFLPPPPPPPFFLPPPPPPPFFLPPPPPPPFVPPTPSPAHTFPPPPPPPPQTPPPQQPKTTTTTTTTQPPPAVLCLRPNVYIDNGVGGNHITINDAHKVYIGNGCHNNNNVSVAKETFQTSKSTDIDVRNGIF